MGTPTRYTGKSKSIGTNGLGDIFNIFQLYDCYTDEDSNIKYILESNCNTILTNLKNKDSNFPVNHIEIILDNPNPISSQEEGVRKGLILKFKDLKKNLLFHVSIHYNMLEEMVVNEKKLDEKNFKKLMIHFKDDETGYSFDLNRNYQILQNESKRKIEKDKLEFYNYFIPEIVKFIIDNLKELCFKSLHEVIKKELFEEKIKQTYKTLSLQLNKENKPEKHNESGFENANTNAPVNTLSIEEEKD